MGGTKLLPEGMFVGSMAEMSLVFDMVVISGRKLVAIGSIVMTGVTLVTVELPSDPGS